MKKFLNRYRPGSWKDGGAPRTPKNSSRVPTAQTSNAHSELQHASLEGLAIEIQLNVLRSLPDIKTLRSLVKASPRYLKAYESQQKSILSRVLARDIGPYILCEAYSVAEASAINRLLDQDGSEVTKFVENYKLKRDSENVAPECLPLQKLFFLAQLQNAIRYASLEFCIDALASAPGPTVQLEQSKMLSPFEVRRIHRALWRFELFCVLFRENERGDPDPFTCVDKSSLFLSLFPPWEVEEIACIRDFIHRRYARLFAYHERELALSSAVEDDSSDSDRPPIVIPLDPSGDFRLEHYAERCMSRGLTFLWKICRAPHPQQYRMLRKNCTSAPRRFLTSTLQEDPEAFTLRTDAYDAWIDREPLKFHDDTNGPNAAWTWSTGDKVDIASFQPEKEDLRKWAYVMWDKERLDRWGILEESNEKYVCHHYDVE